MNNTFNYEIKERLGVISQSENGDFTTEVNFISYNGAPPKVDIRKWDRRTDKMLKGISLTTEEAKALRDTLIKAI